MATPVAQVQDHRTFMTRERWLRLRAAYLRRTARSFPTIVRGEIRAVQFDGETWIGVTLVERADQKFSEHASLWEKRYCVPLQKNRKTPVIDAGGAIVGYLAKYRGDYLWVPWDSGDDNLFLGMARAKPGSVFDGSMEVRMARTRPSENWQRLATCDDSYSALLDIDGNILLLLSHELKSNAVSVGLGPIEYISIGRVGLSILKTVAKRVTVQATKNGIKTLFVRAAKRLSPKPTPAQARILKTQANLQNKEVVRSIVRLKQPTVFRHNITADIQFASFGQIKKGGQITLSKPGINGHYGEGVYAWPAGKNVGGKFIDIEVKASTGVEKIVTKDGSHWYRMVPAEGNQLAVRIVGHNFTKEEVRDAARLLGDL